VFSELASQGTAQARQLPAGAVDVSGGRAEGEVAGLGLVFLPPVVGDGTMTGMILDVRTDKKSPRRHN
jgi:hypothetical protein